MATRRLTDEQVAKNSEIVEKLIEMWDFSHD